MAGHAQRVAETLNDRKGFQFGAVYVWGSAPVRPDDDVYELRSAHADADRVDAIVFSSASQREVIISLDAPGEVRATDTELRVTSASRVRFGEITYVLEGDQFCAIRDGQRGDAFPVDGRSALRLTVAISALWERGTAR